MSVLIKTPPKTVETPKEQTGQAHPKKPTKEVHRHHHHHSHEHAISPPSTGTPHLNPGSVSIGNR